MEWILTSPHLVTTFQVILDLTLILCMVFFFLRQPRTLAQRTLGSESLTDSLEKVIEETQGIAEAFDKNLHERQVLIQELLLKLDGRLSEAQQVCQKLENLQKEAIALSSIPSSSHCSDSHEIVRMARKGLDAATIAKRLQKPVGEVELILKIHEM